MAETPESTPEQKDYQRKIGSLKIELESYLLNEWFLEFPDMSDLSVTATSLIVKYNQEKESLMKSLLYDGINSDGSINYVLWDRNIEKLSHMRNNDKVQEIITQYHRLKKEREQIREKTKEDTNTLSSEDLMQQIMMRNWIIKADNQKEKSTKDVNWDNISKQIGHRLQDRRDNLLNERSHNPSIATILEGDSKIWTVLHYKQLHNRPEHWERRDKIVSEFQFAIFKDLMKRKPKHIFLESRIGSLTPEELKKDELRNAIHITGFGEIGEKPTELQEYWLREFGAGFIYASLMNDVTIHGNYESQEISDSIDNQIDISDGLDKKELHLILNKREELITNTMESFLQKNPGTTIVLIYWAAHSFKDDLEKENNKNPTLKEISFPSLMYEFLTSK